MAKLVVFTLTAQQDIDMSMTIYTANDEGRDNLKIKCLYSEMNVYERRLIS